jgi:hypothetical protein
MLRPDQTLESWFEAFLTQEGAIPKDKGMAGLAWEPNRSVAVRHRKTDGTGDVRPGAKAVDAQAALAIPVRDPNGGVCGAVGIAFRGEREFAESEHLRYETPVTAVDGR